MSKSVVTKALISTLGAAGVFVVGTQVANADTINIASGDTISAYAAKYNVSIDDIVKANKLADANLIIAGHTIEIPGATSDATSEVASSAVADTTVASSAVESSAVASSAVADSTVASTDTTSAAPADSSSDQQTPAPATTGSTHVSADSAGNAYAWGQCTWYVKTVASWAGNHWGNGNQWGASAAAEGFTVNSTPAAGTIVSFAGGQSVGGWTADPSYGHVAYVESYNAANNTITISQGGFGFGSPAGPNEQTISAANLTYIHQ